MWPAGTAMLPTSTTGAAAREPSPPAVQTIIPFRMSVTRTSPLGVAMGVSAARQIGHGGIALGVREVTVTTPSTRTDPATSSTLLLGGGLRTRISKVYESPLWVTTSARNSLKARY